jgi:hypothetical protein
MPREKNLKNFISLRLDDRTIAAIRSKPRRNRSAWLRQIIAEAVRDDAA